MLFAWVDEQFLDNESQVIFVAGFVFFALGHPFHGFAEALLVHGVDVWVNFRTLVSACFFPLVNYISAAFELLHISILRGYVLPKKIMKVRNALPMPAAALAHGAVRHGVDDFPPCSDLFVKRGRAAVPHQKRCLGRGELVAELLEVLSDVAGVDKAINVHGYAFQRRLAARLLRIARERLSL